jgi:hypothetical protein
VKDNQKRKFRSFLHELLFLWNCNQRRAVDNCRLACLIYLNAVIAEYGNFSIRTEQFLATFSQFVEDGDHTCVLSIEHLFRFLVHGIKEWAASERISMVSRMIGVLKRAQQAHISKTLEKRFARSLPYVTNTGPLGSTHVLALGGHRLPFVPSGATFQLPS